MARFRGSLASPAALAASAGSQEYPCVLLAAALARPRSGWGVLIEARSRQAVGSFALPDGCGVAAAPGGFVVTSGPGRVVLTGGVGTPRDLIGTWLGRLRRDNRLVGL